VIVQCADAIRDAGVTLDSESLCRTTPVKLLEAASITFDDPSKYGNSSDVMLQLSSLPCLCSVDWTTAMQYWPALGQPDHRCSGYKMCSPSGCTSWSTWPCDCDPQRPTQSVIEQRIVFKLCVLMHQVHRLQDEHRSIFETALWHQPTSLHVLVCALPAVNDTHTCLKFGQRSFSCAGPRAWKSQPSSLQQLTDTKTFKCKLKNCLFQQAYHIDYKTL